MCVYIYTLYVYTHTYIKYMHNNTHNNRFYLFEISAVTLATTHLFVSRCQKRPSKCQKRPL